MSTRNSNKKAADLDKSSPLPATYTNISTRKKKLSTFKKEMPTKQPDSDRTDKKLT
jgi:hypothetical protein